MPFLRITEGETKTLTLKSEPVREDAHWIGSRSFPCTGEGCKYCIAGFPIRTRYRVDVECDGMSYTWDMPSAVYTVLATEKKIVAGQQVRISRRGTGVNTRYDIEIAGEAPAPGPGEREPMSLDVIIQTLYDIARELENYKGRL